jgi:hypothetical protein
VTSSRSTPPSFDVSMLRGIRNRPAPAEQALLSSGTSSGQAMPSPLEFRTLQRIKEDGPCCPLPTWSSVGSSGPLHGSRARQGTKRLRSWLLRHQLEVLKRQVSRPQFQPRDRVLLAAASRFLPKARWSSFIVRPETLLKWHRHLVTRQAARWGSQRRGRPPIPPEVTELIVRLANDNPRWGYKRIRGELLKLGHDVSAMTIRNILRRHGLGPAPRRSGPSWAQFLRTQADSILASDFFTVYSLWGTTLYVLFFIEVSSRHIHVAGCTAPTRSG